MCGICGIVHTDGRTADAGLVDGMNATMLHRGPDGGGVFTDGQVGLGHRRLSIIDLSAGTQPMSTQDGRVTVVFNGEIYNYLELRAELESLGHVFVTNSDTESILHAYRQWGDACVERLAGMFAFALWDGYRLLLARDRLGKKPLYYHQGRGGLCFGSELKALLANPDVPRQLDAEALDLYLSFGYVPAPRSIYRDVFKLPPAHYAVLDLGRKDPALRLTRYWRLSMAPRQDVAGFEDTAEQLSALLDECVRGRLMSDVPLGAFLSGGVDSSAVVASMARLNPANPVKTAAIGFTDKNFDELAFAREVARHCGTEHHEYTVQPAAVDIIPTLVRHFDEPFADSSAIPTYYVSQMARRMVTVALSGDGGDETFAGYVQRYSMVRAEDRVRGLLPPFAQGPLGLLSRLWPSGDGLPRPLRLKHALANLACGLPEAYARDMSFYLKPEDKRKLYAGPFAQNVDTRSAVEYLKPFFAECEGADAVSRAQYVDTMTYLPEDILVKVDRTSMANSLEVRAPLLDHRILEFAAGLPSGYKLRGRVSKAVLKRSVQSRLPRGILERRKQGFRVPLAGWLKGELALMCHDAIFSKKSGLEDFLDMGRVQKMYDAHRSGQADKANQLWAFMMLGLWRQSQ